MTNKEFEKWMKERIGNVDVSGCLLDISKDYDECRPRLNNFKVNRRGDLLIHRNRTKTNDGWEVLINRERLAEDDWISHLNTKGYLDFGEFVVAYLKACERANIKMLEVRLYGEFDYKYKFADE